MAQKADILIAGGGLAGLTATLAMAHAGKRVICVDPIPPMPTTTPKGQRDLRTTAFFQGSQAFLDQLGVWSTIHNHTAPLRTMRIMDASISPPVIKDFNAAEVSDHPFGWNVENWRMRDALLTHLAQMDAVTLIQGQKIQTCLARNDHVLARLSDGSQIRAQMLIGADGRNSTVRAQMGIGVRKHDYGQCALAFAVNHDQPHENVSTEVHQSGGPFTLVPLPDHGGRPASAVVWMESNKRISELMAMDGDEFSALASQRSAYILGDLKRITPLSRWPMMSLLARQLYAPRTALVAEAAHVVPPIGAQGLNMSLTDIHALYDLIKSGSDPLGSAAMLRAYHRQRYGDIRQRVLGIGMLNYASIQGATPMQRLRALGLHGLHSFRPIRTGMMRLGMGV